MGLSNPDCADIISDRDVKDVPCGSVLRTGENCPLCARCSVSDLTLTVDRQGFTLHISKPIIPMFTSQPDSVELLLGFRCRFHHPCQENLQEVFGSAKNEHPRSSD